MTDQVTPALLAGAEDATRAYLRMGAGEDAAVADAVAAACGAAQVYLGAALAAAWGDVPGPVSQGVVLWAAALIEHKEGGPPAAALALLRPFRVVRLLPEAAA